MKLNNHVPHKLKKRVLKKSGSKPNRSVSYYRLIKSAKIVDKKAYRYLLDRLRIREVLNDEENHGFTGNLIGDFTWSQTPYGGAYWASVHSDIVRYQYDNAYRNKLRKLDI
ncbi:hypothetical protein vBAbaMD22_151 [Acinetobacter phage vB_AbaM_D22]|nr:hypothetical protein vBAbaMD22_151 [Acinetobacter phage vB_AbaM_D22]